MNDRFKFRVWDKINEKWINNCLLDIESGYLCGYYDNEQAYKRRYKIMQCTGLKDKKGKLIYEGDIVKFNFDTDEIKAVVSWDDKELIGFYLNTTDYFKDKYVTDYDFYKNDYEVIGNIYENKELLNENS